MSWVKNTESDLTGYQIWRKENNSSWSLVTTIGTSIASYTDAQVYTNQPYDNYYYKVCAIDNQNKTSVFSNEVTIKGLMAKYANGTELSKELELAPEEEIPTDYSITQNYPNPFNPTTQIFYQIPKEGFVSLNIYNSLGQEVNALVHEYKNAGSYTATFDATNLPSGVYFYSIQVNEFRAVKKMMLIK